MKKMAVVAGIACLLSGQVQAATIGALVQGGLWGNDVAGGAEQNYAYVSGSNVPGDGLSPYSYQAEASFNIDALTPVLRAEAFYDGGDGPDEYVAGRAYAYQTYQYTGTTSHTYTIDLGLHGVLNREASTYIDAAFMVYNGTQLSNTYCGSRTRLDGFGSYACNGILAEGFTYGSIELASTGEFFLADQISFQVNPGDTFLIYAALKAHTFGGSADAFHTFTAAFDDTTDLVALGEMPAAVPVPAAVWLFMSGLLGLVGISRKKRNQI